MPFRQRDIFITVWCVWAISPLLFMETRPRQKAPEGEKSRPDIYWCFCNNILKVVFLVKVFESGTRGSQPRRAFTIQMVTALWWFCLWGATMETFGLRVSHTYRSQDGQSLMPPENTHTICTSTSTQTGDCNAHLVLSSFRTPLCFTGHKHSQTLNMLHTQLFISCVFWTSHPFYCERNNWWLWYDWSRYRDA